MGDKETSDLGLVFEVCITKYYCLIKFFHFCLLWWTHI